MANDRVLWTRPENCTCGAKLKTTGKRLELIRERADDCPTHGKRKEINDEAVERAVAVARTVPGLERMNAAQLRRIIEAIVPILAQPDPDPTPSA